MDNLESWIKEWEKSKRTPFPKSENIIEEGWDWEDDRWLMNKFTENIFCRKPSCEILNNSIDKRK